MEKAPFGHRWEQFYTEMGQRLQCEKGFFTTNCTKITKTLIKPLLPSPYLEEQNNEIFEAFNMEEQHKDTAHDFFATAALTVITVAIIGLIIIFGILFWYFKNKKSSPEETNIFEMNNLVLPCSTELPQSCSTEYDYIDETHFSPTMSLLPSKARHENAIEKIVANINPHHPNLSNCDGDDEYLDPVKNTVKTTIAFEIYKTIEEFKMTETIVAPETATISVGKDFRILSENIQMHENRLETENGADVHLADYIIPSESLTYLEKLGTGNSADVYLADYKNNSVSIKVAVKILKPFCRKEDTSEEIKLLSFCKHENIVSFIGWMEPPDVAKFIWMETSDEQMGIITEYMGGGDLYTYLINSKNRPTISKVFSFAFQILNAVIYLHDKKGIIHRDLAARNCLLNENYEILKLNDFGISRKTDTNGEYKRITQRELPFCWLPLETLKDSSIFTQKGDIWAFGVLLWEMFQRGQHPYAQSYNVKNPYELAELLSKGERLSKPEYCHEDLYEIMISCWKEKPEERPTFKQINERIHNIYDKIEKSQISHNNLYVNIVVQKKFC